MENMLVWFDVSVKDIQRAAEFYGNVFDIELQVMEMNSKKVAFLPFEPGVASGCLIEDANAKPASGSLMVYLNGGDDLAVPLSRVKPAGGEVVLEKTSLGGNGFMAHFKDPDGNVLALHSRA